MRLDTVNTTSRNINFSGKLIKNKPLRLIQKHFSRDWENFINSDYYKFLHSDSCKSIYQIRKVEHLETAIPHQGNKICDFYGVFKDGIECKGLRASIGYTKGGIYLKCGKQFFNTFKNAIAEDILETKKIV